MRTTIRMDDDLLREAKRRAADRGCTLTAFFEQAVRAELRRGETRAGAPIRIEPFHGTGPREGVRLDDNAGLRDLLDRG